MVRLLNGFLLALLAFEFKEAGSALDFSALIGAAGVGFGLASVVSPWLERHLREEPMVVAALAVEAAAAFVAGQFFSLGAAAGLAGAAGLAWGTAKFGFDGLLQSVVHPARRGGALSLGPRRSSSWPGWWGRCCPWGCRYRPRSAWPWPAGWPWRRRPSSWPGC